MADLAASGVVVVSSWYEGHDRGILNRHLRLTLSTMGTATNKILASVLGFAKIERCSPLVKSDDSVMLVASPSYDGSMLLTKAAGSNAPADFSGTYECVVTGRV